MTSRGSRQIIAPAGSHSNFPKLTSGQPLLIDDEEAMMNMPLSANRAQRSARDHHPQQSHFY